MQMLNCTFCSTQFVSQKSLNNHMNGAKYCHSMKHFSMNCSICNFTTNNLQEAQRHTQTCDPINPELIPEPQKEVKIIPPEPIPEPQKEVKIIPPEPIPEPQKK